MFDDVEVSWLLPPSLLLPFLSLLLFLRARERILHEEIATAGVHPVFGHPFLLAGQHNGFLESLHANINLLVLRVSL